MNAPAPQSPLDVRGLLSGARLLVMGGTGFLGKVWWGMLLDRFPDVEHIWLVCRPKKGMTSEQRFWKEVAPSEVFEPLRQDRIIAAINHDFEIFFDQRFGTFKRFNHFRIKSFLIT